jgi:RimJ/RimL family protein N-acetyltransferase
MISSRAARTPAQIEPAQIELAARLPDIPRWVELRPALLHPACELVAFDDGGEPSFALFDHADGVLFVVGTPSVERIATDIPIASLREVYGATASVEPLRDRLVGWQRTRVLVHELREDWRLPAVTPEVRLVDPSTVGDLGLPEDWVEELRDGADGTPIVASYEDDVVAATCYAGAITEAWWDVAIDTVEARRRKGHAGRCAAFMVRHMRALAKEPVWQSAEDNPASWKLAAKLGFVVVDEMDMLLRR